MKNKILNRLVTVKSIVTLTLTLVFAYLSAVGKIEPSAFQDLFYIVLSFYFGTQAEKATKNTETTIE